jgi:hypothetical protein
VTPEQEGQVRRALAAIAHADDAPAGPAGQPAGGVNDPPTPADVVARLDGVLGELVAPRVASTRGDIDGDELAARRRRRWPNALVAAAALCVIGLAGGAVVTGGFGMAGGSRSDTETAGVSASDSETDAAPKAGAPSDGAALTSPDRRRSLDEKSLPEPTLHRATLAQDVQRLVDERPAYGAGGRTPASACAAPPVQPGETLLEVRLDGRRSALVLGVPDDGRRQARVYSCTSPGPPVATTSLRSP